MDYVLLLHDDESWTALPPEAQGAYVGRYFAYAEALKVADALKAGEPLAPAATAKIVRVRGGATVVEDGPFADAKERLGGVYVIAADDLDAALDWAALCPGAVDGVVEVRPAYVFEPM